MKHLVYLCDSHTNRTPSGWLGGWWWCIQGGRVGKALVTQIFLGDVTLPSLSVKRLHPRDSETLAGRVLGHDDSLENLVG